MEYTPEICAILSVVILLRITPHYYRVLKEMDNSVKPFFKNSKLVLVPICLALIYLAYFIMFDLRDRYKQEYGNDFNKYLNIDSVKTDSLNTKNN